MIALIWAEDEAGAIGAAGGLPWGRPIAADMRWFRRWTLHGTVLMGRATWESLPRRPLPDRRNLVVSRTLAQAEGATLLRSLDALSSQLAPDEDCFVIGGAQLFAAMLPQATLCLRTRIFARFAADRWFPEPHLERLGFRRVEQRYLAPGEDSPWPLAFERWQRR